MTCGGQSFILKDIQNHVEKTRFQMMLTSLAVLPSNSARKKPSEQQSPIGPLSLSLSFSLSLSLSLSFSLSLEGTGEVWV